MTKKILNKNRLVLTGFMGSGKTTLGKILALKLNLPFRDLDKLIESACKKKVTEIFAKEGEAYFREQELINLRQLLTNTEELESKGFVLALGGGAFINPEIRALCQEKTTTIYLKGTAQTLSQRIIQSRQDRPLFSKDRQQAKEQGDFRQLELKVEQMLEQRQASYLAVDLIVEVDGKSKDEIVDAILNILELKHRSIRGLRD